MKKFILTSFLFASSLAAQVQLGKGVQIGGTGSGGATLPTSALVYGISSTTSRAATVADITNLVQSATGCTSAGNFWQPASGTCVAGGGGATLPTSALVFGLSSTTSRAATSADMATLVQSATGCSSSGNFWNPFSNTCTAASSISGQTISCGVKASSSTGSTGSLPVCDDGTTTTISHPLSINTGSGQGGTFNATEGTAATAAAGHDVLYGDSTSHCLKYSVNGGAFTCLGTGSGSLPSAAQPGQIITSTAAGTTYAAQGQVFYQQSGDTIASIETACSTLCTYIVSAPQTITLAANHTLSSNVQVSFLAGGLWTVNGAFTLTIPGGVTGTLNRHFAGTSTIAFGISQTSNYAEWFGAVADWNGTTGTNDTVPIQTALNAMTAGYGVTYLQPSVSYMISGAINIPDRGILVAAHPADFSYSQAIIVQTNASADIIRMVGTSGAFSGTQLGSLNLQRSVLPTGTATGVYSEYNNTIVDNVSSGDSVRDFYLHGSRSRFYHSYSAWGFQGLHEPAGNYYGVYMDASDGVVSDGLTIADHTVNSDPAGTTGTFYGVYVTGTVIPDIHIENLGTNGGNYPIQIIYTGTGGQGTAYDIHIINSVLDHFSNTGILVSGLPFTGADSSLEIKGGTVVGAASNSYCIHITNSAGVSVIGMADISCQLNTDSDLLVDNSSNIILQGNIFGNIGPNTSRGITLNNTAASSVIGNTLIGTSTGQAAILINGTSNGNAITGNSMKGPLGWGIYADTATTGNTGFGTNGYSGTITTPLNDLGSNPTKVSSLVSAGAVAASTVNVNGSTSNALIQLAPVGGDAWDFFANGSAGSANWFGFYDVAKSTIPLSIFSADATHSFLVSDPTTVIGFSSTGFGVVPDVGISRCGAGKLCVGNGTKADVSAEVDGTTFFAGVAGAAAFQMNASQLQGQNSSGVQTIALNGSAGSVLGNYFLPGTIYKATGGTALPTCAVGIKGAIAVVSDATSPTYNGTYTSGGLITVPVVCSYNGTTYAWLTH